MSVLIAVQGTHRGQRFALIGDSMIIGRDRKNDIRLEDEGISRRHSRIFKEESRYFIEDIGSTNGTFVNNVKLTTQRQLFNGDRIVLGNTVLLMQTHSESRVEKVIVEENPHKSSRMLKVEMDTSSVHELLDSQRTVISGPKKNAKYSLSAIYDFITQISGILDLDSLLEKAIEETVRLIGAERGAILLLNNHAEFEARATYSAMSNHKVVVSKTIVDEVLTYREGVLSAEAATDDRFRKTTAFSLAEINSLLCVPLVVKDKALGALYVDTSSKRQPFCKEDLQLLTAIGLQLSICIENSNLYAMLKDSEEFGACVLRHMAGGLLVVDLDGKILRCNENCAEICELFTADLLGHSIGTIDQLHEINILVGQTLKSDKPQESESLKIVIPESERRIPIGATAAPLVDYSGSKIGAVVTFRDLTHIQQLAQQVQRVERLGALGQMASGIAHEIRNPLNSVQGFVQILKEDAKDAEHSHYCDIILDEVRRINGIVQGMLDFSRQQNFSMQPIDAIDLCHEVCEQLSAEAETNNIELTFSHPNTPFAHVTGNHDKLKGVLVNIINNAIQASETGGKVDVSLDILQEGFHQEHIVCFVIKDTGIGIEEKDLSHIFDPFFTKKDKGTGLGLSICQKVVEMHSGRIEVNSVVGEGSEFKIVIPAYVPENS